MMVADNSALRREAPGALSWYGSQVRLAATKLVTTPIVRTVRLLLDEAEPAVIELVAADEDIRDGSLGTTGAPPTPRPHQTVTTSRS